MVFLKVWFRKKSVILQQIIRMFYFNQWVQRFHSSIDLCLKTIIVNNCWCVSVWSYLLMFIVDVYFLCLLLCLSQEVDDEFSHTVMHGKKIQKALTPGARGWAQPPRPVAGEACSIWHLILVMSHALLYNCSDGIKSLLNNVFHLSHFRIISLKTQTYPVSTTTYWLVCAHLLFSFYLFSLV